VARDREAMGAVRRSVVDREAARMAVVGVSMMIEVFLKLSNRMNG